MLLRVKSGNTMSMFHNDLKYAFRAGEVKDCPNDMLEAFRGILVPVQSSNETPRIIRMPIINISKETVPEKIVVKTTKKKNIKKKKK